jgi:hypothetical protein
MMNQETSSSLANESKDLLTISTNLPALHADSIDFSNALRVVNRTRRFVLEVPTLENGGELLVYPEGCAQSGEAIKKTPEGATDRGVIFFNTKDSVWQAARGNGKETILINDISAEQAGLLHSKLLELGSAGPLDADGIRQLLRYARDTLGCVDFYDKKLSGVEAEMKVIDEDNPYYREVTKETVHLAVLVRHGFTFEGPVPQVFPEGAIILNSGKHSWGIDKGVFQRNFKAVQDGALRSLQDLEREFPI